MIVSLAMAVALAGGSNVAAGTRCNNYVATSLEDQVRNFEKHAPKPQDRNDRFAALQQLLSTADQEEGIIHAVCTEKDDAPIQSQLLAVTAWATLLQADLNRDNYQSRCPDAAQPVERAFVGNAWLLLVRAGAGSTAAYPTVSVVVPKLRARAAEAALALPAPGETSGYWVSQLQQAANAATGACKQ